jgi:transcriptional regulator with XRE-family HTH domain
MNTYRGSLSEYVMARRGILGMSQTELAEKAGLSKSEVNAIERGRVLLPGADKRRRLAEALRGFHAELLVNAGEITPEEIIEGANAYDPARAHANQVFPVNSPAAKVVEIMRTLPDEMCEWVLGTARFAEKQARGEKEDDDLIVNVGTGRRRTGT